MCVYSFAPDQALCFGHVYLAMGTDRTIDDRNPAGPKCEEYSIVNPSAYISSHGYKQVP